MIVCLIVGAGAAGIGMGCVLQDLNISSFSILERGAISTSFLMWPKEMRMITPSFTNNAYGKLDLNAISLRTSPAYTLGTEYPSGEQYADYLQAVADFRKLLVQTGIDVTAIQLHKDGIYELDTNQGAMYSQLRDLGSRRSPIP
ncbi:MULTISPECIES: NAD(P)-binding domain-containing protein [Paenibacillus]|uniref:NAD(P)-binding domain-containing protein n=1 Tax=Paenibacillus TaxID=44249 RepID=UPI0021165CB6|nr:NAD(P)-binding domain-containing protein [Paenibacillus lautus]